MSCCPAFFTSPRSSTPTPSPPLAVMRGRRTATCGSGGRLSDARRRRTAARTSVLCKSLRSCRKLHGCAQCFRGPRSCVCDVSCGVGRDVRKSSAALRQENPSDTLPEERDIASPLSQRSEVASANTRQCMKKSGDHRTETFLMYAMRGFGRGISDA
eukprot:1626603-Pleurochrysis_carterae.AAC.3